MATDKKVLGVAGFFDGPEALLDAMKKTKGAGFKDVDAFSPFPVHGMDDAQGLSRSCLPWITFTFGLIGVCAAFGLQYFTSAMPDVVIPLGESLFTLRGWDINVGGKPFNSWPAFVPVMFELTILFAGISTVFGMFALNRLPNVFTKTFDPGLTTDRFAILIEAPCSSKKLEGKSFDESGALEFLKKIGASEVRTVYKEGWFA